LDELADPVGSVSSAEKGSPNTQENRTTPKWGSLAAKLKTYWRLNMALELSAERQAGVGGRYVV